MDTVTDDRILQKLRELAPHHVRIHAPDESHRDVKVPDRRKRWGAVMQEIANRPWVRIEMLDKAGMAIAGGTIDNGAPGELEDIGPPPGGGRADALAQERWLRTMLEAQRVALTFRDRETQQLLSGVSEVLRANTEALRQLTVIHTAQLDAAIDAATRRAEALQGDDMDKLIKLLEASPDVVNRLAPIVIGLAQRFAPRKIAPPAKPAATGANGAKS